VPFTDTSPEARDLQFEIQRRMTAEQRLLLAFEMSLFSRELTEAAIRKDHPQWSEAQVKRELLRLAFSNAM
jgi:hypothetical protein